MLKKKLFNFRPFLIFAIAIIVSILSAIFIFDCDLTLSIVIFASFLLLSVAFVIIFLVKKFKIFTFCSAICFVMAIPFLSLAVKSYNYNQNLKYETDNEVLLLAKICDHYKITKNKYLQIIVDDVEILFNGEVEKLNGKVVIYAHPDYFDLSKIEIGKYVYAQLKLDFETIESKDSWDLSNLSKNIIASGFASYYKIKIYDEKDKTIADEIKSKVFDTLKSSNMKNADLAYAMIFGDSNIVDSDVKTIFQSTGIAHLLAVSGLHVSAIVFAISFLLKKLKMSQKSQLILLSVLLFIYCYLCNFSISVIRSSLMAVALNYSYVRGKAYDRLSVLSMIATFILLINPLQLFNISFVLSFSAVLSIILLSNPMSRLFNRIFYKKFANTLGVLFAIQLGLMSVNLFYFGTVQPLSFFANLVSIPLATFAFILIIVMAFISMILPFMNFACVWIGEIFELVTKYNGYIHDLNISLTISSTPAIIIPFAFALMFVVSDYCFANKRTKIIVSSILSLGCIILFFI